MTAPTDNDLRASATAGDAAATQATPEVKISSKNGFVPSPVTVSPGGSIRFIVEGGPSAITIAITNSEGKFLLFGGSSNVYPVSDKGTTYTVVLDANGEYIAEAQGLPSLVNVPVKGTINVKK